MAIAQGARVGKKARRVQNLPRTLSGREARRGSAFRSKVWTPLQLVSSGPGGDLFENAIYTVRRQSAWGGQPDSLDEALWLVVNRKDGEPARDWRHLQAIKSTLAGETREGIELFPSEHRVIDVGNSTHLYVLAEGEHVPFGATVGRRLDGPRPGIAQRPFDPSLVA